MILKGIPEYYKPFSTGVTQQKEEWKFSEFKFAIRSYEEIEKCRKIETRDDYLMKMSVQHKNTKIVRCYNCQKIGHKSFECKHTLKF